MNILAFFILLNDFLRLNSQKYKYSIKGYRHFYVLPNAFQSNFIIINRI